MTLTLKTRPPAVVRVVPNTGQGGVPDRNPAGGTPLDPTSPEAGRKIPVRAAGPGGWPSRAVPGTPTRAQRVRLRNSRGRRCRRVLRPTSAIASSAQRFSRVRCAICAHARACARSGIEMGGPPVDAAAGSRLVYVIPEEWSVPDLPVDPPAATGRGPHGSPDFDRSRFKVLFARPRSHTAGRWARGNSHERLRARPARRRAPRHGGGAGDRRGRSAAPCPLGRHHAAFLSPAPLGAAAHVRAGFTRPSRSVSTQRRPRRYRCHDQGCDGARIPSHRFDWRGGATPSKTAFAFPGSSRRKDPTTTRTWLERAR